MRLLQLVFNFYIESSLHVALASTAMTAVTFISFGLFLNNTVLGFVFCATICGYNFVKYFNLIKMRYAANNSFFKAVFVLSLLAATAVFFYLFNLQFVSLLLMVVLGVITIFYALPIVPINGGRSVFFKHFMASLNAKTKLEACSLRTISGLKIYIIALVWAGVTVIFPLLESDYVLNFTVVITLFQRFLYLIVLMIPFEIRDLKYDARYLQTLPQKVGVNLSKVFAVVLLVLFVGLDFLKYDGSITLKVSNLIISIITFGFVVSATKNQSKYFSSFWVESLPILWLVLLLVFG